MKKILVLLMIVPMIGIGQVVVSSDYCDEMMMLLGVKNPITVEVAEVKLADIAISINQGKHTKVSDGQYNIIPSKAGKLMVSVYGNDSLYGSVEFKVISLPPITPQLHHSIDPKGTTVSTLINSGSPIIFALPEIIKQFKEFNYRIISFDIILTYPNATSNMVENISTLDDGEGKRIVESARPGDWITIKNIKYRKGTSGLLAFQGVSYNILIK